VVAASPFLNLIANPSFESGTAGWTFYTNGNGSFSTVSPAPNGAQAARLNLTQLGNNTQLYQPGITLKPNTSYWLSFSANSKQGATFRFHSSNTNLPSPAMGCRIMYAILRRPGATARLSSLHLDLTKR
jgi:hypothetical protein